jgi:hypothetical protein
MNNRVWGCWAVFPVLLVALAFVTTCERSVWPDLQWWPVELYVWTFGAGACTPLSARLYLVVATAALTWYVAMNLWRWAQVGERGYVALAMFWGMIGVMIWAR